MKRAALFVVLVAACKSSEPPPPAASEAQDASMQKPLPTGMLNPPPPSTASAAPSTPKSLKAARDVTTGEWIELQPAPEGDTPKKTIFEHFTKDSLFLPLDAMTLLHDTFAQVLPGFTLFTPQLYTNDSLVKLRGELRTFRRIWLSIPTAAIAKHRYPFSARVKSVETDAQWKDVQNELVSTIDDIITWSEALTKKGDGAWVLPAK